MADVIIPRSFRKMLLALSKSDRVGKLAVQRAESACTQASLSGDIRLERTHNGESRLDCEKYELGDGYRLIMQRTKGEKKDSLIMLFVGSHADSDNWLARHRNYKWVRKVSDGKLDFIQVSDSNEPRPSALIDLSFDTPEHVVDEPLLSMFTEEDFSDVGLDATLIQQLLNINKGDWGESHDTMIDEIEKQSNIESALLVLDLLTMADVGDIEGARQRLRLHTNLAHEVSTGELLEAVNAPINGETFYTWKEEENMPAPSDHDEWMLYLHPEQKKIALADVAGPSRLRGVSGSGKTSVLVHRARHLAMKYNERVLVVTLTDSMRKLLVSLVTALCGAERSLINIATIQSVAREIVQESLHDQSRRPVGAYSDEDMALAMQSVPELNDSTQALGRFSPQDRKNFLKEELSFIRTRLVPADYEMYATAAFRRIGRGKALAESSRKQVLQVLRVYEQTLMSAGSPDFEGIVQEAIASLENPQAKKTNHVWRAVLADEVQDLSQNEIRMLSLLHTPEGEQIKTASNGLFLVGDGAQTIYKRGFSLQALGITLSRASVFKKNYRNTKEILQAAYALIINFEFADIDEDTQQKPLAPDYAIRRGERPSLVRCKSKKDELDYVVGEITNLRDLHGESILNDICIISRSPGFREDVIQNMNERGIPCVNIKESFVIDSIGVCVSTVESAKGLEFGTVFLANVSEQVSNVRAQEATYAGDIAKLYVAMTRARDSLHISYISNSAFCAVEALNRIDQWCESLKYESGEVEPLI